MDLDLVFFGEAKFHLVDRGVSGGLYRVGYFPKLSEPIRFLLVRLRGVPLREFELGHLGLKRCRIILLLEIALDHVAVVLHVLLLLHGEPISPIAVCLTHVLCHFNTLSQKKEGIGLSLGLI